LKKADQVMEYARRAGRDWGLTPTVPGHEVEPLKIEKTQVRDRGSLEW
jgi:hypothetical protein